MGSVSELHSPVPQSSGSQAHRDGAPLPHWTPDEAKLFFNAYGKYNSPKGVLWEKVARAIGTKTPDDCQALYSRFKSYLSLPKGIQHQVAFLAMVKDMVESESKSKADEAEDMKEGQGFRHGSEDPAEEDSLDRTQSNGLDNTQSMGRARRTPRGPAAYSGRSGSRGQEGRSLRSPEVLTPSQKLREAEEDEAAAAAVEDTPHHTSWGGRGRRGATGPSQLYPADSLPAKRKRAQARLSFTHIGGPESSRRAGMDAGDADGADALLSLAKLANAESSGILMEEDIDLQQDTYMDQIDTPSIAARPRRSAKPPPKADDSPPPPASTRRTTRRKREEPATRDSSATHSASTGPQRLGRGQRARNRRRRAAELSDSDYSEADEVQAPPKRKTPAKRATRLATLFASGFNALQQGEDGEPVEEERTNRDAFWHGFGGTSKDPMPRLRRRKALPEKLPPMMSPIKSLFGRRTNAGLMLGLPGHQATTGGLPGVCFPGMEGEESGFPPGEAELSLRRCLDARTRRWAAAEFFYSAVDRPWFMQNELKGFLEHVGVPQGTKLTATEWGLLRASLGKPRRFSLTFLRQERARLEAWRNSVREKYEKSSYNTDIPAALPRQLTVSQRVTARHPVTRQLHDGDVLTIAPDCYRVQFDRRELGVELVKDVDVMPIDPTENLPSIFTPMMGSIILNGRRPLQEAPRVRRVQKAFRVDNGLRGPAAGRAQQEARAAAAAAAAQQQLRSEADVRALMEVSAVLDRKESLLMQLRNMNDEAEAGLHLDNTGRHTEAFQVQYAHIVLELKQINDILEASLGQLQARNHPHAEAVAAALNRTGSTERRSALLLTPSSPLRQRALQTAHASKAVATAGSRHGLAGQRFETPEAAWDASWKEGQRLVKLYQAELQVLDHAQAQSEAQTMPAMEDAGSAQSAGPPAPDSNAVPQSPGIGGPGYRAPHETQWLTDLVNGCVSTLLLIHQCTETEATNAYVELGLREAMRSITPRSKGNKHFLADIQNNLDLLKQHLVY
ncbi:g12095 [Coccomyxa viridis]|uniref:G12095 protein n=1 Tax=Coccomyxa viridis TaxID=1274662 RepID=A0ABP1GDN1_9CHLO